MHFTLRSTVLFFFLISSIISISAQKRQMVAVRVSTPIKIDGDLNDEAWSNAIETSEFVQFEPERDAKPTYDSKVKIVYDNQGIYVGAHLLQDPSTILTELSQRDQKNNVDWFGITLDPYQSGLNGFAFLVSAAGVQQDIQLSIDSEDSNWDAVWESSVAIVDDGWIVEMFLPYSAIRFADTPIQEWNIQFGREIRYLREQTFWNRLDPTINGFINQCGVITGIRDIKSPVRLSLTPFVVGYLNNNTANETEKTSTAYSAGMDLKYGINDAFTLDMTLIPDFGQVISDNVVVNLGPFEQFFEENRAFFTEGIELFNKGNLFYTRRIGGRPVNYGDVYDKLIDNEVVTSNPSKSPLINATKVSGRTAKGTGAGIFNAVVGDEYATVTDTLSGDTRNIQTNPNTNYNVIVLDQNLPNNSVISFVNTNVLRFGEDYDANVTGAFFDIKNKSQNYGVKGKFVLSQKYFEDGKADLGHSYSIGGGKIGGKFRATATCVVETENYDHNDMGFLFSPNEQSLRVNFSYDEFNPSWDNLVRWRVYLTPVYERLYKPNVFTNFAIRTGVFLVTKNRLGTGINLTLEPIETKDFFEPRTDDFSKFYKFPRNFRIFGFVSSDYRKPVAYDINLTYRGYDEDGRYEFIGALEPRIRFNNKFSLFGSLSLGNLPNQLGFVSSREVFQDINNLNEADVMFGRRDRIICDNSLRLNYIFTNNMSLSLRARHYWDRFQYNRFSKLESDGRLTTLSFNGIDEYGEPYFDSNVNIFNIDLFYTWRFAPGSDIVVAWKNSIYTSDDSFESSYFENLTNLFDSSQFNSVSLRVIYFLDYHRMVGSRV